MTQGMWAILRNGKVWFFAVKKHNASAIRTMFATSNPFSSWTVERVTVTFKQPTV